MKTSEIYRDTKSAKLGYRVVENNKTIQKEVTSHADVRKLRRYLRATVGKSVRIPGLGA